MKEALLAQDFVPALRGLEFFTLAVEGAVAVEAQHLMAMAV